MTESPTGLTPAPLTSITAPTPLPAAFPVQPALDVLDLLPAAAAGRLRALRQRSADSHALVPPFSDIQEASAERTQAQHRLARLLAPASEAGFNLPGDDARVIAAQRTLAKATNEFERLKQRSDQRSEAWRSTSAALSNVEIYLREGRPRGTVLEESRGRSPGW